MRQSTFATLAATPADSPPGAAALRWSLGLLAGLATATLIDAPALGLGAALLVGALIGARIALDPPRERWRGASAAARIGALWLAPSLAWTSRPLITVATVLACLALVALSVAGAREPDAAETLWSWTTRPLEGLRMLLRGAVDEAGEGIDALATPAAKPLLRGAALAAMLALAFFLLLANAEPAFAAAREWFLASLVSAQALTHLFAGAAGTFATLGLLAERIPPAPRAARLPAVVHTDLERLIVLGALCALFATFLALQAPRLFGDPGGRPGSGLSYASAVHQGFGEISIVVTLTALVLLALERRAARGAREGVVRLLALLLLAECALLLASAWLRLATYESAYGYTDARVYVRAYLCCLAAGIVVLAWEVHRGIAVARLCARLTLVGTVALAALAYGNPSAWIVRANVERWHATGRIDLAYLAATDDDGLPQLAASLAGMPTPVRDQVRSALRLGRPPPAPDPWYAFNARRRAARAALEDILHAEP